MKLYDKNTGWKLLVLAIFAAWFMAYCMNEHAKYVKSVDKAFVDKYGGEQKFILLIPIKGDQ